MKQDTQDAFEDLVTAVQRLDRDRNGNSTKSYVERYKSVQLGEKHLLESYDMEQEGANEYSVAQEVTEDQWEIILVSTDILVADFAYKKQKENFPNRRLRFEVRTSLYYMNEDD